MNKVREKERHINKVLQQRKKNRDRERDRESGDKKIKGNGETQKINCYISDDDRD